MEDRDTGSHIQIPSCAGSLGSGETRFMIQLALNKKKVPVKILCLGSHCDDIEIGCGGTLLKLIQDHHGNIIARWVVFSSNAKRKQEAIRSAQAFLKRTKQQAIVIEDFEDSFFPYQGSEI